MFNEQNTMDIYKVVVNEEGQYSIWPATDDNPPGWQNEGKVGRRTECNAYIQYCICWRTNWRTEFLRGYRPLLQEFNPIFQMPWTSPQMFRP